MSQKLRVLTGITTTGTPHLGNYVGAIRPAIAASRHEDVESFYFLADLHALIKCEDPQRIARSRLEIAATWLALGLDTDRAFFYAQSDVVETTELTWLLTCVTAKGLLNRAHAYKASVDRNAEDGEDTDAGINAGLFMYPVLMAADILIFNANKVPVGRDQVQHIEMARDIAQRFNHLYGNAWRAVGGDRTEPFTLPEAQVDDHVSTLPGLDGRKMSKSYNNTIPLWLPKAELRKAIMGIVTDSRAPGEVKETEGSNLFAIYQAFASADETAAMRQAYADGISWGDAKQKLFERIDAELAEPRDRYETLVAHPDDIQNVLSVGARKARERSLALLARLRETVGIGTLAAKVATPARTLDASTNNSNAAQFKSYRGEDGKFYFKLFAGDGSVVLESLAFESPKVSGAHMARLLAHPHQLAWTPDKEGDRYTLIDEGAGFARGKGDPETALQPILVRLHEDKLAKQQADS